MAQRRFRVPGVIRIVRPGNVLVAAGTSLTGTAVSGAGFDHSDPWVLALTVAFLAAFGNVLNDIYDVPIDRINRPDRPLPAGELSTMFAFRIAGWCMVLGLVAAATRGLTELAFAMAITVALFVYDRDLKRRPLSGNVVVASFCALTVLFGALPGRWGEAVLTLSACAFAITLARELWKDIEDRRGDAAAGARTFALLAGSQSAARLASASVAVAIILVVQREVRHPDFSISLILGAASCIVLLVSLFAGLLPGVRLGASRHAAILKLSMLLGLAWVLSWA